jgi:outer membrane protein assembly factor BamD (BamD/ComL family)
MRSSLIIGLAIIVAVISGCATVSWLNTRLEDTVADYQKFINEHPDNPRVKEARQRIEFLDYEAAGKENTAAAYERFIEQHPSCRRALRAQQRIKELKQRAQESNNTQKRGRSNIRFKGGKIIVETTTQD